MLKPNVSHCIQENEVHYNPFIDYSKKYLTFNILESGSIDWSRTAYMGDIPISYSLDSGETWTEIGGNFVQHDWIRVNAGDKVIFKGNINKYSKSISRYYTFSGSTASFDVEGNIMSLISGDSFSDSTESTVGEYEFYNLFESTNIINAENLVLPATTLANRCYLTMFGNCSSLTTAPSVLPTTTLGNGCYYGMFSGCTNLTTAPELPATTLADSCYQGMFAGCTSLTTAPELHATTLEGGCYSSMFKGCTSLTTAPELHATTLADSCYQGMFEGCTSLTTAPQLLATTLPNNCYRKMFQGCTSLTAAPQLLATTLANECYYGMFYGCTNISSEAVVPSLYTPSNKMSSSYCSYMYGSTPLSYNSDTSVFDSSAYSTYAPPK